MSDEAPHRSTAAATASLREKIRQVIDHVAGQPDARRLCRALAMSDGATLQIAICDSPRASAALQLWLADAVPSERGSSARIERLSPYPLDFNAPGPEQVDLELLGEVVLRPLRERGKALARSLVFIDAAAAGSQHIDAWRAFFIRLNERRNLLARDLGAAVTLVLPPSLEVDFARLAPDVWSVRSTRVEVRDLVEPIPSSSFMQAYDLADGSLDIAELTSEVTHARERARSGHPAAVQALQVLLLKLAGASVRTGQLDAASALIDEASALAQHNGDARALAASQLAASDLLVVRGDLAGAKQVLSREVIPKLAGSADAWDLADARGRFADILELEGALDEAYTIRRDEELPTYEQLNDQRSYAITLAKNAAIDHARGDSEAALNTLIHDVLPVVRRLGDRRLYALTMGRIADIHQARGALDEALRIRREEELPIFDQLGDVRERTIALGKIAKILQTRGELDEALRIHLEEVLPVYTRLGDIRARAQTQSDIAEVLRVRRHYDDALRLHLEEEIPVYKRVGDRRSLLAAHSNAAVTMALRGRSEDAAAIREHLRTALELAERCGYAADVAHIRGILRRLGFEGSTA